MSRYFVKRILQTIPLMLVISILVFLFIHMIPGRSGENNGRTGCRTIRSRGDSRRVRIKRSADRAVCELYERFVYRRPWKKFKI